MNNVNSAVLKCSTCSFSEIRISRTEFTDEEWQGLEPEVQLTYTAYRKGWSVNPDDVAQWICPECMENADE